MIQIKCNVCDKSPVHRLPKPDSVTEGTEVLCSNCNKWLATAIKNDLLKFPMEWDCENDTYYDEDKNIWYKNYPVEYPEENRLLNPNCKAGVWEMI